ncbi:hypothetical protein FJT64_002366 [Amphibalanus amphitrite]|uniref:Uncharacterized protein n=1 Tax=Amphibalanus amphitrite TaxID=1232801 RepID=A0A6A4WIW7_AMPAM|nr:hypothetical protein FJT64_002366 [Amphibalanus amphitrite]
MKTAVVLACLLVVVAARPQFGLGTGFSNGGSFQSQQTGFLGSAGRQTSFANSGGFGSGLGGSLTGASNFAGQGLGFGAGRQVGSTNAFSNTFGR